MVVLGLDQSVRCTGYSVYVNGELKDWGTIDLHRIKNSETRWAEMCKQIQEKIKKCCPDVVVLEDVSLRQSIKTLISLSRLQGAIIYMTMQQRATHHIYAPTQWRGILGIKQGKSIKRPELKKEAIEYVQQSYGITLSGDDEAEGICIGATYIKEHNKECKCN